MPMERTIGSIFQGTLVAASQPNNPCNPRCEDAIEVSDYVTGDLPEELKVHKHRSKRDTSPYFLLIFDGI